MNDDELKAIWKVSSTRMDQINLHSLKMNKMNAQIKKFEKIINKRNNLEIIVAIFSIVVFGIFAYIKPEPLAKIGAGLIILYCLHVIYQFRNTESKQPNFDMMLSLKEQLLAYQSYVLAEQKLHKNILYWYLLPMLPGLILFLIGSGATWLPVCIYFGVVLLVFAFIYKANQKVIEKRTQPLLAEISKTLKSLEEEEG